MVVQDSGSIIYILDTSANLFFTQNSGFSWVKMELDINREEVLLMETTVPIACMRFFNKETGLIILRAKRKKGWLVLRTENGGKKWSNNFFEGENGTVYLSRDGNLLTIHSYSGKIIQFRYVK